MYGYIRQGRRTALTRELIGGVAFQVLTVGTGPLRRVRARRLLRRLAGQGVSAAVFEDGAGAVAAGTVRRGGGLRRSDAGGDGVVRYGGRGAGRRGGVSGGGLHGAAGGAVRGGGAGAVAGVGAAAGGAVCGGQMGAIANSCGIGDFPRLTGGGKLTIMQRDILCVFCLFRGILPIERNVQHGERIQNESGPL